MTTRKHLLPALPKLSPQICTLFFAAAIVIALAASLSSLSHKASRGGDKAVLDTMLLLHDNATALWHP